MKKKYETFYTCPGCGQLVPKDTTICDCGYIFKDIYKVSVFKVILGAISFWFILSLLYSLSYGILCLVDTMLWKVPFVSSLFRLPAAGILIEAGLFLSALYGLFSAATSSAIFLFNKVSSRYLQCAKALLGGSILCTISFTLNLIWHISNSGDFIAYYILALIQSLYVLFITHRIHSDAESKQHSGGISPPAILQESPEEKKLYAQERVDAFYAEVFSGQTNPYTGLPIESEQDYLNYLQTKAAHTKEGSLQHYSMGRSFDELVREQKLEQAQLSSMSKEAYAQYCVDAVCARLFKGQINPYTQREITCEADYREYQRMRQSSGSNRSEP